MLQPVYLLTIKNNEYMSIASQLLHIYILVAFWIYTKVTHLLTLALKINCTRFLLEEHEDLFKRSQFSWLFYTKVPKLTQQVVISGVFCTVLSIYRLQNMIANMIWSNISHRSLLLIPGCNKPTEWTELRKCHFEEEHCVISFSNIVSLQFSRFFSST